MMLFRLVQDPVYMTAMQTYKGWVFILMSSLFFYIFMSGLYRQIIGSSKEYEDLFTNNRDGLLIMDYNGIVVDANESFVAQIGTDLKKIVCQKFDTISIIEWEDGELKKLHEQISNRGYTDLYSKNIKILNGEQRPFEIQSYGIHRNNVPLICSFVRDVTSSQLIYNELIHAKNKAEENDNLKTAFLQNMSHEIRTPLNGILGFSELLKMQNLNPEKRAEYIETIIKSGNQLLTIVNDILDISKIETGQQVISESEFNINHLIDELKEEFEMKARIKGLALLAIKPLADKDASILADRSKIHQIFSHLINNAIKFTAEGSVKLGYRYDLDQITFFVLDTGMGIPRELHNIIFERFRKSEINLRKDFGGTGLGLAICKGNVELLKGQIWVESAGKGAQFYFSIAYKSVNVTEVKNIGSYSGLKVLVAEDEDINFNYIREVLFSRQITVERALHGVQAIEMMNKDHGYDIVFMDIRMPKMDGLQATRKIREFDKKTPIIAQTAYVMNDSKLSAYESGCNDYVSKPIKKAELLGMIDKYVRRVN